MENTNSIANVLSVGPFGHEVAGLLNREYGPVCSLALAPEGSWAVETLPHGAINILISSRPVPDLCRRLNERCFERSSIFLPMIICSGTLQFGPVVIPGVGGCWRCASLREHQHEGFHREANSVEKYYSSPTAKSPRGFLYPDVVLAASHIYFVLTALESPSTVAGTIWDYDLFTRIGNRSDLVSVDGCTLCGLQRPRRDRSYSLLRQSFRASQIISD